MIATVGFYTISSLLVYGIAKNTHEVIKIGKQRKKLKELIKVIDEL